MDSAPTAATTLDTLGVPSITLGFTVAELFKASMVGRAKVVATVAGALIAGLVLPSGVKVGDLEGILEKMLYKFLGEGLVSVEAMLLPILGSRGIMRLPVAVAGVVKAVPATSTYNFLEEVEGSTSVPEGRLSPVGASSTVGYTVESVEGVAVALPLPATLPPSTVPSLLRPIRSSISFPVPLGVLTVPESDLSAPGGRFFLEEKLALVALLKLVGSPPSVETVGIPAIVSLLSPRGISSGVGATATDESKPLLEEDAGPPARPVTGSATAVLPRSSKLAGLIPDAWAARGGGKSSVPAIAVTPLEAASLLSAVLFACSRNRELDRVRAEEALVAAKRELGDLQASGDVHKRVETSW